VEACTKDAGVTWRGWESVFGFEPIVAVAGVGDEMSAGLTEGHEQTVANDERIADALVGVAGWNVDVPAGEISAVEQTSLLVFWRAAGIRADSRGRGNGEDQE
jgi:hypothetical protein